MEARLVDRSLVRTTQGRFLYHSICTENTAPFLDSGHSTGRVANTVSSGIGDMRGNPWRLILYTNQKTRARTFAMFEQRMTDIVTLTDAHDGLRMHGHKQH